MGIDESFFNITQNNIQKEYDIVYCGSINRYGLIKTLINLSKLGLKILVIGNVSLKIEKKVKKNIILFAQGKYKEIIFHLSIKWQLLD